MFCMKIKCFSTSTEINRNTASYNSKTNIGKFAKVCFWLWKAYFIFTSNVEKVTEAWVRFVEVARRAFVPSRVFPPYCCEVEQTVATLWDLLRWKFQNRRRYDGKKEETHRRIAVILLPHRRTRWIRIDVALERHGNSLAKRIPEAWRAGYGERRRIWIREEVF